MITVLIPMFNEEQTIVNQLSAIMVSNIPLKLLIVNDGSTDISLTICNKFISDYKSDNIRCKILNKPHSGYSDTINFALRLIDTEYFTILDSDDTVDPKIFSVVCKLPNLSDYDLICWNSGMAQVQFSEKYQIFNYVATTNKIINDQYFGGYCWNKLYRTDIVRDNLLSFDSSIHFMSDKLFTVEYWNCASKNSLFINHVYYKYNYQEKEQKYKYRDFCTGYDACLSILDVPVVKNNKTAREAQEARLVHICMKSARTSLKNGDKNISRYIKTAKLYKHSLLKSKDFSIKQKLGYFVFTKASFLLPSTYK